MAYTRRRRRRGYRGSMKRFVKRGYGRQRKRNRHFNSYRIARGGLRL